ncbi:hypothetical protein R3P38DRAFT_2756566 [Favolaschia claudopus]|uniref:Uncharacterized protein n=1 Tax=Favolaschia claudopus TaxID=2862362 RepID=A0AAW0EG92_9AGAR
MSSYVVTGASRGIGLEFVKQLSANDKNQVFAVVRNKSKATFLQDLSRKNVTIVEADVTDAKALGLAAAEVAKATGNKLDYLINNAGSSTNPGFTLDQLHQQRQREIQRAIRESNEASPRRRRVPAQHDENVPPATSTSAGPNARSLGQLRRHQRARENRPNPPTEPLSNRARAQRARRERERAEKAAMMDVDDPPPNARNSRVLQVGCQTALFLR